MAFSTPARWIFRLWLCCGFPLRAAATASVSQLKGDLHQTQSVAGTGRPFPIPGPEPWTPRPDLQLQPSSLSPISLLPKHGPALGQSSSTCRSARVWWPHTWLLEDGLRAPRKMPHCSSQLCAHTSLHEDTVSRQTGTWAAPRVTLADQAVLQLPDREQGAKEAALHD